MKMRNIRGEIGEISGEEKHRCSQAKRSYVVVELDVLEGGAFHVEMSCKKVLVVIVSENELLLYKRVWRQ